MTRTDTTAVPFPRMCADVWRTLRRDLSGSYRPERHYMRGPGPKWREKHTRPTAEAVLPPAIHVRA
jgi:hypothetical protein